MLQNHPPMGIFALPSSCVLRSDDVNKSKRQITFNNEANSLVTVQMLPSGLCQETEVNQAGERISQRRFVLHYSSESDGTRWEIALLPPVRVIQKDCPISSPLFHFIARKFAAQPFRLLIEHFGHIVLANPLSVCPRTIPDVVANATSMKFRTIEYNSFPYFLRELVVVELKTFPDDREKSLLTVSETVYRDKRDGLGQNRQFRGNGQTKLPGWVICRFSRCLDMLIGEG